MLVKTVKQRSTLSSHISILKKHAVGTSTRLLHVFVIVHITRGLGLGHGLHNDNVLSLTAFVAGPYLISLLVHLPIIWHSRYCITLDIVFNTITSLSH